MTDQAEKPKATFDWKELKRRDQEARAPVPAKPERGFTKQQYMEENGLTRRQAATMISRMLRNGVIKAIGRVGQTRSDGLGGVTVTVYDFVKE